jgi:hypothetical protein
MHFQILSPIKGQDMLYITNGTAVSLDCAGLPGRELTGFGRKVLAQQEDHVRANGIDRWLGGVHLCNGAAL